MKKPRILIVEDEGIIARDIRLHLVELGYDVVADTPTGEEAIVLTGELHPDLLLMDIHLAGKIDGIEAAQIVRRQFGTPVVFLTAFAGAETLDRAKLSEPFGYIIKPFDERYLHTVIEMALYKHRAEGHLRRAYDEQATILRTAIDAFLMADWQGRLLDVNESACLMFGYSRDELLAMSLSALDAAPGRSRIQGLEGLKQPENARFERTLRRKDGDALFVEMSVNYLPHSGGRIFCFARDITERKAAEDALVRLNEELEVRVSMRTQDLDEARKDAEQANRAKAAFLATMTHELRTPLNGVIGLLDVLKSTTLESHQSELVEVIGESATSLLGIVDDILDFSKIEAGRLGLEHLPMSVQAVVEKAVAVLAPMAQKAGVELTLFTDPRIPAVVQGDAVRLKQVLLNLANNAVKFSSRQERPSYVSVRARLKTHTSRDATIEFEVKDNGIGMDDATVAGLFKSFTQGDASISRRFGGTGLGLAISRNLVELMGGTITVESEPGRGSTFRISVTFAQASEPAAEGSPILALAGLSCVIVGDSDELHQGLAAYLDAAGAALDTTPDLESARRLTQSRPAGLSVWILDLLEETPPIEALRRAADCGPQHDIRFVLLGRGRRQKPRPTASGVFVVDLNLLRRDTFIQTVARAAGRVEVDNATTPVIIHRAPKAVPSREEALARRELILVAEDNEINQQVILRQLGLLGYTADVARDGHEALELWRSGDYALLLADLHMPEMDGYQLTAAIRVQEGAFQHAVIIALTADVLKGGAQQCRDAGLDDYLCKPARLSEVKAMLEKWLPKAAPPASGSGLATPQPTSVVPPPLDLSVLEELVGRDPDVIREFLRAFWISTAKTAAEIREACDTRNAPLLAELAHKLKAPARSVGALRLAELCDDLQRAGQAKDFAAIQKCLPLFEGEKATVGEYLRQT